MAIFRDRPELHIARRVQRARRWVGTKVAGNATKLQATHVGAEVLTQQTPKVRATHAGAEVLTQQTPKLRASHVGMELLLTYPLPTVTTKYVSHLYEDYV